MPSTFIQATRGYVGRWKLHGSNDHVRLHAQDDCVNKTCIHDFRIEEPGESNFGEEVFRSFELKRTSIFYVVSK
jgi:hypothetical protein